MNTSVTTNWIIGFIFDCLKSGTFDLICDVSFLLSVYLTKSIFV